MRKILDGPSRRVGSILNEIDTNFIEVCNSIFRIAFPDHKLKGYAETEPAEPILFDCYLVKEDATIWGIVLEKDDIITWSGIDWELIPFKITELNAALQFLYFDADKIDITPIDGLAASNVQSALADLTAAIIAHGITITPQGSGSI
jgi:hypothetical protein